MHRDVVQVVGGPRGGDVALDVRRLERALRRRDLERLQQRRVDDAHDQRHEGPDPDGQHREGPALAPDVEEQDHGGEDRHVNEQRLRRQAGVHVGVAGAVDVAVLGVHQRPALQDVAHRLVQGDQGQQHRDVRLHGRSHPRQAALGLDPAVEVVEDHRDGQRHDQDGQRPVDDEDQEGELEDVEADVLVELGVGDVEEAAVAEQDPVVPLARPFPTPRSVPARRRGRRRCARRRAARTAGSGAPARPPAPARCRALRCGRTPPGSPTGRRRRSPRRRRRVRA